MQSIWNTTPKQEKEDKHKNKEYSNEFWVLSTSKRISFREMPGYERIKMTDQSELWELIHQLVNVGYLVQ